MENGNYCIGIMSVGSGVGQSVISSCNLSRLPIKTIGLGINPMAFGAYECDEMDYVPSITSKDYINVLIDRCHKYKIDIIIPGLDDEVLILAKNKQLLEEKGVKVLASEVELLTLTRDKARMCEELSSIADLFVKSYGAKEVETLIKKNEIKYPLIAKPRSGSASEGIEILLENRDLNFITDQHIIQEIAFPYENDPFREDYLDQISKKKNLQVSEISIQVVTDKNGDVIGKMASYNKLKSGVPIEIIPYDNEYIWGEIDKLLPYLKQLGHRGPLNIQGRLTTRGFKIFEMNARFTGITGLRAMMGFNEVEACIKNWLGLASSKYPLELNFDRFGIRQTTDKVISCSKNKRVKAISDLINKRDLKTKKTILVTGASGYLGQMLIGKLINLNYEVWALSRDKNRIEELFSSLENVRCFENDDIYKGDLQLGLVDTIIHCGFARPYKTDEEIAESLKFTSQYFNLAAANQVPEIINISSQSVYGTKQPIFWTEETAISPESLYAQAKYSTELMAETVKIFSRHSNVTSLRLSSLAGGQSGIVLVDIISRFVHKALNNEVIEVFGGTQKMQRLDVRDAADGIIALMKTNSDCWAPYYNLGPEGNYTILEMTKAVAAMGKDRLGREIDVNIKAEDIHLEFGMDSSRFYSATNWRPKYTLDDIIESLFEYLK